MLKQKHAMEEKAQAETAAKKKVIEEKVNAAKMQMKEKEDEKDTVERVTRELIEAYASLLENRSKYLYCILKTD